VVSSTDLRRSTAIAWITLGTLGLMFGCGGELPKARTAARLPLQVFEETPVGVHIATLPRPTPGLVKLLLFIDAGSRDAVLPETATLSAWLAADGGGAQLQATVYPDATEIALSCTPNELDRCTATLARALAMRSPTPDAVTEARVRLRDGQRRALAADPLRALDALALRALLGPQAEAFFPLATPDSDLVAASDAVPRFLADHYGPKRTLLVAAGDVEPKAVREAVTDAFARSPQAALKRSERALTPVATPQLNVAFDEQGAVGVALAARDLTGLHDAVANLTEALARSEPRIELSGSIFAVRTGALALLRTRASDPELALDHVTRELARIVYEGPHPNTDTTVAEDVLSSARRVGFEFAAGGTAAPPALQFGAALYLSSGAEAPPPGPDSKAHDDARIAHAQATFATALKTADPHTSGDVDAYVASVAADSGAHIDVQFTQGSDVAIAVRVGLGADRDSPLLHGQAALLAELTGRSCAGMAPDMLRDRFAQLGASYEARVDAESYGLLIRTPKDHWQAALDLGIRCMRAPAHDTHAVLEASLALQSQLRQHGGAMLLRARTANMISPRAPGPLAPRGDPDRIANISVRDVDAALANLDFGERWAICVVGPVDVPKAVALAARRTADLTSGAAPAARWSEPAPVLPSEQPRSKDGSGAKLIAAWTTRGNFGNAFGARLFARAVAALLSGVPGVEPLWHDGDIYKETAFAAVELRIRPELAPMIGELLAGAAHNIDDDWLEHILPEALAEAAREDSARDAEFSVRAERVARTRLGANFEDPDPSTTRKLIAALRSSRPGWTPAP
jgi:predicted Zn-dependent peptidase